MFSPVVTIQTEYRGASAEIVDTQITQKIEDFVGGTPGLETIDSFSEDESSRITLTFETDLDLDDVTNDVRSSVARVLDNLPEELNNLKYLVKCGYANYNVALFALKQCRFRINRLCW